MDNTILRQDRLILIKDAEKYFDSGTPLVRAYLKYLLVKDPDKPHDQILLMEVHKPFEYHAEGLLYHMTQNGIKEMFVHGGGNVLFHPFPVNLCHFTGKSYAFGTVDKNNLELFCATVWPELGITDDSESIIRSKKYSLEEIRYKAEHP